MLVDEIGPNCILVFNDTRLTDKIKKCDLPGYVLTRQDKYSNAASSGGVAIATPEK
jgi:hypothetical protein